MRNFKTWLAVLVVPAVFATAVYAEDSDHPQGATLKLILLRQKSVQEELKVSPELKKQIHEFTDKQEAAFLEAKKLGAAERKEKFAALAEQNEKFLKSELSAGQQKRLGQITMQFAALAHLLLEDHVKALKLTEAQVEKLKELQKDAHKALEELIVAKEAKGRNEKLAKHREDIRAKILVILTDAQKEQVREIAGPAFTGEIVFED